MKIYQLLVLSLFCLVACGTANRQEIDLSDQTTDSPADGIGHYVYALALPNTISPGETLEIQMDWRTVGPTDGRKRFAMDVLLEGEEERQVFSVDEYANTVGEINLVNWLNYYFKLREDLLPGEYTVAVRLRNPEPEGGVVELGFDPELGMTDGYYRVAELVVLK